MLASPPTTVAARTSLASLGSSSTGAARAAFRSPPLRAVRCSGSSQRLFTSSRSPLPSSRNSSPFLSPVQCTPKHAFPTRTFTSTVRLSSSSPPPTTVQDAEPENGLYYHPVTITISNGSTETPTRVWALSFLSQPPSSPTSASIVAYLLPSKESPTDLHQQDPSDFIRANPDRISVNPEFWKLMHATLKDEVVPTDELLEFEANTRKSGWAHLTDLRHPLNPGRIATPESIIASVAFVDGELQPESYEANASYRLVTGYEGPIHMPQSWIDKIRAKVKDLN